MAQLQIGEPEQVYHHTVGQPQFLSAQPVYQDEHQVQYYNLPFNDQNWPSMPTIPQDLGPQMHQGYANVPTQHLVMTPPGLVWQSMLCGAFCWPELVTMGQAPLGVFCPWRQRGM
jgi:hypothetical protein